MPYSLSQSLEDRIHTSIASSLKNFLPLSGDSYIDCLVLHSPFQTLAETHAAWGVFSSYVPHKIRALGISNTSFAVLQSLCDKEAVPPSVVQNRFYADTGFEVPLRRFCREKGIVFQSFWTFTGNPQVMVTSPVVELAKSLHALGVEEAEVLAMYALVIGLEGVTVLDGTTKEARMKADLTGLEIVGAWSAGEGKEKWVQYLEEFKTLIGEEA